MRIANVCIHIANVCIRIANACILARGMETGQRTRRLTLVRNVFSRPEAGKQNGSVSGTSKWIGTEDGRLASAKVMLEGIILCV